MSWAPAITSSSPNETGETGTPRIVTGGCDNYVKIFKYNGTNEWVEDVKLERHSDWVRHVAWAPSIGLGKSMIATCSQVCTKLSFLWCE